MCITILILVVTFKGKIMNIFEKACRIGLMFNTSKGSINAYDVWSLPLESKSATQLTLDSLAQSIDVELSKTPKTSFVRQTTGATNSDNELRMEIVKHVISVKLAEEDAKQKRVQRQALEGMLRDRIEAKKLQELDSLTIEQLEAKIASLNA